jgi:glyoxalase-like protein
VPPPRIRQAVLAARDLDAVAGRLREELELGEPFSDPGVGYFGLRNAVFALGDTFLEVVSPVREGTSAGRLLERRGGDCGYMVMFQVDDLAAARARADSAGVREVFEVALEDIEEVHLHPGDMRGAIVSMSAPEPPESWRWGGPGWEGRSADLRVAGVTIGSADPADVAERWRGVVGEPLPVSFVHDDADRGPIEIVLAGRTGEPVEIGGVRFAFAL